MEEPAVMLGIYWSGAGSAPAEKCSSSKLAAAIVQASYSRSHAKKLIGLQASASCNIRLLSFADVYFALWPLAALADRSGVFCTQRTHSTPIDIEATSL